MIEALFWGILALGIVLVFLSYFAKESLYSLFGFGFIFVLGAWVLLTGSLQHETGTITVTNHTYVNDTLVQSVESTAPVLENYATDNTMRFWSFWLTLLGAFGIFLSLTEVKRVFKSDG